MGGALPLFHGFPDHSIQTGMSCAPSYKAVEGGKGQCTACNAVREGRYGAVHLPLRTYPSHPRKAEN
jgi:hypothetical protein